MTAKANDMPLCVDSVHAERPERHLFNYLKKSCLFCRRHSLGFEHEAIGRAFHREEVLLGKPSRHHMLDSPTRPRDPSQVQSRKNENLPAVSNGGRSLSCPKTLQGPVPRCSPRLDRPEGRISSVKK